MHVIELHVLNEAMPSCVAITADVLATANRLRAARGRPPAFGLRLTGSGARGVRTLVEQVMPAERARQLAPANTALIASLVTVTEAAVQARLARRDATITSRAIDAAAARGAEIAASCSAVFLVAATGMLDGHRATTTWWLAPALQRMHPAIEVDAESMVVRDRRITTAGAAMAHLDLMLALVGRHGSADLARRCARFLVLDGRRSQARYMALAFLTADDPAMARVERWARTRLAQGVDVEALAQTASMSTRTFARHLRRATGLTPVQFLQRLRLEQAVEMLETTTQSVEAIARAVGYAEPTTLRRLLRRELGGGPRTLRVSGLSGS